MTTLRIARLRKRYRLPHGDRDGRARLDGIIATALGDGLFDAALDRVAGIDRDEICVRRLTITSRLRADDGDARNAAAWSIAVSDALAAAMRDGRDVVRYGSRHHAIADMVARAPLGIVDRVWAWRQLGLWTIGELPSAREAANEVLATLTREARSAVAVLSAAARIARPALQALVRLGAPERWHALAAAALAQANGSRDIISACDEIGTGTVIGAASMHEATSVERHTLAATDAFTRAFAEALRALPATAREAIATPLATIAMLAAEPSVASAPVDRVVARVQTTRDALLSPSAAREHAQDAEDVDDRARSRTNVAGLLFMLHIARAIDLPLLITASPVLRDRPSRWVLHRLAVESLGIGDDDAGALAFAGLGPDATPPSSDEPPCTGDERDAVLTLRDRLAATLRLWLGDTDERDDARLFGWVCQRRGEILADPAWIDVRLPIESVDPAIRRAGLDLDPEWCAWIGAVVRIVYV